jgi:predicted MFS family arabinose efflux permease
VGLTPGQAGMLLAAGSAGTVAARILVGHLADRLVWRLRAVAVMLVVAGATLALLTVPHRHTVVVAGLLAFTAGWAWPGLVLYAVPQISGGAPSRTVGLVQGAASAGAALGPAAFGSVIGAAGYGVAWLSAAACCLLGAGLIAAASSLAARATTAGDWLTPSMPD